MKLVFSILLFFPFVAFGQELINQYDSRGLRTGLWMDSSTLSDGSKTLSRKCYYQAGKMEGMCVFYWEDITVVDEYHNDTLNGKHKVYRSDSTLYQVEHYKMGKLHGKRQFYDEHGILHEEGEWEDGKPLGLYRSFYPSGRQKSEIITVYVGEIQYEMEQIFADSDTREVIQENSYINRPVLQDGPPPDRHIKTNH